MSISMCLPLALLSRSGRFYFRFPDGEAGTDVFDRVASFITYLFRSMDDKGVLGDYFGATGTSDTPGRAAGMGKVDGTAAVDENYVLVTHGLLMRIFCMTYLRWTVSEFEQVREEGVGRRSEEEG